MRKVINKMVTEEDLIRTVAAAYSHGWRQVKLYFMCGLPTETDEDVLAIADLAKQVIAKGREVSGRNDIRCTVSIGGFVPKPHTPFQWAAQLDHDTTDERLRKLREEVRADKRYGRAIGFRYHDGKPGIIEGLLSPRRPPGRRGHRAGVARRRPVRRLERALLLRPLGRAPASRARRHRRRPRLVHHPRARLRRGAAVGPPRLGPRQGLAVGRLGGRARGRRRQLDVEVEDCRWTPCYDCGVCPEMGTEIQIGPTGRQLLPLASSEAPASDSSASPSRELPVRPQTNRLSLSGS